MAYGLCYVLSWTSMDIFLTSVTWRGQSTSCSRKKHVKDLVLFTPSGTGLERSSNGHYLYPDHSRKAKQDLVFFYEWRAELPQDRVSSFNCGSPNDVNSTKDNSIHVNIIQGVSCQSYFVKLRKVKHLSHVKSVCCAAEHVHMNQTNVACCDLSSLSFTRSGQRCHNIYSSVIFLLKTCIIQGLFHLTHHNFRETSLSGKKVIMNHAS